MADKAFVINWEGDLKIVPLFAVGPMMCAIGPEGPIYADRVNGRLTFHDWEHWTEEDQFEWRDEFMKRASSRQKFDFMKRLGLIDERFS